MGSETSTAVLEQFLRLQAGQAVVRLRDVDEPQDAIFTGTFISPAGHLLTSYHALQARLYDIKYPESFDISFEFDPAWLPPGRSSGPFTRRARCERGWRDQVADLALLKIEFEPPAFLPISPGKRIDRLLGSQLRAYGYTVTQVGQAALGEIDGSYLRALPEQRRFRMANVVRGGGQSGGPILDLDSRGVTGVVVGFLQQEINTGDGATTNQETLLGLGLDVDLADLADEWRRNAALYLRDQHPQFALLERQLLQLPEKYVYGRPEARQAFEILARSGRSVLTLHGPPGAGKTSIALEVASELESTGTTGPIFWYDFAPDESRSAQHLVRSIGLYLLEEFGSYDITEAYPLNPSPEDDNQAISSIAACMRRHPCTLVLDNIQFVQRDQDLSEIIAILTKLTRASRTGISKLIFTSWDPLAWSGPETIRLHGFTTDDVSALLALHGIEPDENLRSAVAHYRHDITAVQILVRQPDLRKLALTGKLPREPQELHRYWLTKYRSNLPKPARRVLLALAVLNDPAGREELERIAETEDLYSILDELQTSPPLVQAEEAHSDGVRYYLHHNVRQAMLSITDRKELTATHKVAAEYYMELDNHGLTAARHWLEARESEKSIEVLHNRRDSIIGSGGVEAMMQLAERIESAVAQHAEARYKLNVILASGHNIAGQYEEAEARWQFALDDSPDLKVTSMLHNRRADTLRLASDYTAADGAYQASIRAAQESGSPRLRGQIARSILGRAKLNRLRAKYDDSLASYAEALRMFKADFDQIGIIEAEFGLGEVHRLKRNWSESENWYSRSLQRAQQIASKERTAYALWGLGEVHRLSDQLEESLRLHEDGLLLCREVGDTRSEGWALLGIAEVLREAHETQAAELHYELASDKFTETRSTTEIAHAALGAAENRRLGGELDLNMYAYAEKAYRTKELIHCLVLALLAKGLAFRSIGDEPNSAATLAEAEQLSRDYDLYHELGLAQELRATSQSPPLRLNYP